MRDNKAFASLSSGLLARKGQARPAMRPQGFNTGSLDDLGWNDMGHDAGARPASPRLPIHLSGPVAAVPVPVEPPVVLRQQEEIAREFAASAEATKSEAPPRAAEKAAKQPEEAGPVAPKLESVVESARIRKAAFTLRLDAERHLRLRLACAVQGRSAQQLVTEALDRLLETLPDVARLAASLPAKD